MSNMPKVTLAQFRSVLLAQIANGKHPVHVFSGPGVGKSAVVAQVAAETGSTLINFRVALMDLIDMKGLPTVQNGTTSFAPLAVYRKVIEAAERGPVILFFDEASQGMPSVQNTLAELVQYRRVETSDIVLPDNVQMVLASNRQEDKSGTNKPPRHLMNRTMNLEVIADLATWVDYAAGAGIDHRVIAFVQFRPELFNAFDPKADNNPTPRAWEYVSHVAKGSAGLDQDTVQAMVAGYIGEGPASEFRGFLKAWAALPSYDEVVMQPDEARLPREPSEYYAVSAWLAGRVQPGDIDQVAKYLNRFSSSGMSPEFQQMFWKLAGGRDPSLKESKAYIQWCSDYRYA